MTRDELAADPVSANILADTYDFDINGDLAEGPWFSIEQARITPIAADAAEGLFCECQLPRGNMVIVYASSESQGGVVATDLGDWLEILVSLPYWFDLLKFSAGGSIAEMRRAEPFLIKETNEDRPEIWQEQSKLRQRLQLATPIDPVARLHGNVTHGKDTLLRTPDGILESLFNRFRVEDNPTWRGGLTCR